MNASLDAPTWSRAYPEGRWAGMGPYYAMFPISFAKENVERYSEPGDKVIDPFFGRGTTPFVAQMMGRHAFGCELNPVGWVYGTTKTSPHRNPDDLIKRVCEIANLVSPDDRIPENDFQDWAFHPDSLGFIRSARMHLDWKESAIDRTLFAFLLVHLHAKLGDGISNQMRQSKSMAPDYAVRWWKQRNMRPPQIDPVTFFQRRISWRYAKGLPRRKGNVILRLGDARDGLKRHRGPKASLVLTSPPYMGVTNYEYDNWIRLWALGGPSLPSWSNKQRYLDKKLYTEMLKEVFELSARRSTANASVVVRTDARKFTLNATSNAIRTSWPNHKLYGKWHKSDKPTQTQLFGDKGAKPGEVDLIALPQGSKAPLGFCLMCDN